MDVVILDKSNADLLTIRVSHSKDETPYKSFTIGKNIGGFVVKSDPEDKGVVLLPNVMGDITRDFIPVENYLDKSLAPIGDFNAILNYIKDYL